MKAFRDGMVVRWARGEEPVRKGNGLDGNSRAWTTMLPSGDAAIMDHGLESVGRAS